jgi:MoxR-like ATPase
VVAYVQKLRQMDLFKSPGVAETIDWATALTELDRLALDPETVSDTLGTLLKYQDDIARIDGSAGRELLAEVKAELANRCDGNLMAEPATRSISRAATAASSTTSSISRGCCARPASRSGLRRCAMRWRPCRLPA